jgi:hypothetical protein
MHKKILAFFVSVPVFIASCNKNADNTGPVNRKAHSFTGTVTSCASGKPLPNVTIELTATNSGMFFGGRETVGSAITDSLGHYFIPGKDIDDFAIKTYDLEIIRPGFNGTLVELLDYDEMPSPNLAFIYNIHLTEYAVILYKIIRQNRADTNKALVRTYQKDIVCFPRYNSFSIDSRSVYTWQNSGEKVQYIVRGGDSVYISKRIITPTDTTAEELTSLYLNPGDTAVFNITY